MTENGVMAPTFDIPAPLPLVIHCTVHELQTWGRTLPSPRIQEMLRKLGSPVGELMELDEGKFRYAAFRVLLRDYPERDITSLWLHSYDCEIEVEEPDPTGTASPTASLQSVPITTAFPKTSTS